MNPYTKYLKKDNKNRTMLFKFHEEFSKIPRDNGNNAKGEQEFSKPLVKWVSKLFKEQCGLGINDEFKTETLWSRMNGQKQGAPFKTYLRVDRFLTNTDAFLSTNGYTFDKDRISYRVFLCTHNMQADTDMSDGIAMYIEFDVIMNKFNTYSYHFEY